jgi:exonuclease III
LILQLGDALISYVLRRLNGRGRRLRRWKNTDFKLWYTGKERSRNSVGILIDKSLKNEVVAVRRQGDRIIMIKLIFGDLVLNVISVYAPQVGLSDDVKRRFWEDLEDMVRGVSSSEKLLIGGDLNGHVGTVRGMFERVHGGLRRHLELRYSL